jgi:hypothetical protein
VPTKHHEVGAPYDLIGHPPASTGTSRVAAHHPGGLRIELVERSFPGRGGNRRTDGASERGEQLGRARDDGASARHDHRPLGRLDHRGHPLHSRRIGSDPLGGHRRRTRPG